MDLIVLSLGSTAQCVREGSLAFVGAVRMDAETGVVSASMRTFVRPEPAHFMDFVRWADEGPLTTADLDVLPMAEEALMDLSRFVGDDVIIAHRGNETVVPLIRYHCQRLGIATRRVRLVDSGFLPCEIMGKDTHVFIGLRHLARLLDLREGLLLPYGPVPDLEILRLVALRLWAMHEQKRANFLYFIHDAIMPVSSPQVGGPTAST